MLLMKHSYFDAIRSGQKTTTLRYWRRPLVKPGGVHTIRGLGRVRIEKIACIGLDSLTLADARNDGFNGVEELKRALIDIYPRERRQGRKLYKVRFTFLGDSEQ